VGVGVWGVWCVGVCVGCVRCVVCVCVWCGLCVCVCVCASVRICHSQALLYTASEDLLHPERKYVLFLELMTPQLIAMSGQLWL